MKYPKLHFVGIKALVENKKGQILLLLADVSKHRKNSEAYWDIPGGRIEEGDGIIATLEREIEEETGIPQIGKPEFITAVISNHQIPVEGQADAGLVLMVYKVAIPEESEVVLSEEHSSYEWVDKVEAAERLQHKYPKEFTEAL